MALRMKTFSKILNDMILWITSTNSKLSNFFVGSVIRSLLEAVSMELESMYFQMHKGFKWAIENSIFHSFGFYQTPATAAVGQVTLTFKTALPHDVTFLKGFKFSTLPLFNTIVYFTVVQDTVAVRGTTSAILNVQCTQTGTIGNVPANSIRIAVTPVDIVQNITNTYPIGGGAEKEASSDRKKRFTTYIQTLARGTSEAVRYGCISVPGVAGAYVSDGVGSITAYVHDSAGNLPDALRAAVVKNLVSYRSGGVEVIVLPVVKRPTDISIVITLAPGFEGSKYNPLVQSAVTVFLNNFAVSKGLMLSSLIKFIMGLDDNAIINVKLSLQSDVTVANHELIRAGNITVSN